MKKFFAGFYALMGGIYFTVVLLLLYPFFLICMIKPQWHKYAFYFNQIWARVVYFFMFAFVTIEMRLQREKGKPYIYCPNHTSYLDISLMCYAAPQFVKFMGKASLGKAPIFGYYFRKIHITVDRKSRKSRAESFKKSLATIEDGNGVCIFPEGGIYSKTPPTMTPFKDGAFRLAIETQTPIVPVTIPYHWLMMPGITPYLNWHKIKIIFHEAIDPKGMTLDDVPKLKEMTYNVIEEELKKHFPEKFEQQAVSEHES